MFYTTNYSSDQTEIIRIHPKAHVIVKQLSTVYKMNMQREHSYAKLSLPDVIDLRL